MQNVIIMEILINANACSPSIPSWAEEASPGPQPAGGSVLTLNRALDQFPSSQAVIARLIHPHRGWVGAWHLGGRLAARL